jgi:hypothetical protein
VGDDSALRVDLAAAGRVARAHDVDIDTALEILSLVRNNEKLAGKLLDTVSRGISGTSAAVNPKP